MVLFLLGKLNEREQNRYFNIDILSIFQIKSIYIKISILHRSYLISTNARNGDEIYFAQYTLVGIRSKLFLEHLTRVRGQHLIQAARSRITTSQHQVHEVGRSETTKPAPELVSRRPVVPWLACVTKV